MTTPIYSRPQYNRFLGNDDTYEVHDLWNESPDCRIDEIFKSVHAVVFSHDSLIRARADGYRDCRWCI